MTSDASTPENTSSAEDRNARGADRPSAEFAKLSELIRQEWPTIDKAELEATRGDLEGVVDLVAERTEHTRTLVRRQLDELRRELARPTGPGALGEDAVDVLRLLRSRVTVVARELQSQAMTEATAHVKKNPLTSLLVALGLGFLLGLVLRGGGRRGRTD
jgi:hypothetical protein